MGIIKSIKDFFGPTTYQAPKAEASAPIGKYMLPDRGIELTDQDLEAFRPIAYGEISNRSKGKKSLEANVIFNTALNRVGEYSRKGKKKTLSEVLAAPNQYQAYNSPQYKDYYNPRDPVAMAKKKEVDMMLNDIYNQVKSGQYKDNTGGAYYYIHNPDGTITYDNKRQLFAK